MFSALNPFTRYAIIVLLVALAATGLGWFVHTSYLRASLSIAEGTIQKQEGTITKLGNQLETAVELNKQMEHSITVQNKQVSEWLEEVEKRRVASADALAKAKAAGEAWKKKYSKLLDAPPSNPTNDCESLTMRIDQYLELRSEP